MSPSGTPIRPADDRHGSDRCQHQPDDLDGSQADRLEHGQLAGPLLRLEQDRVEHATERDGDQDRAHQADDRQEEQERLVARAVLLDVHLHAVARRIRGGRSGRRPRWTPSTGRASHVVGVTDGSRVARSAHVPRTSRFASDSSPISKISPTSRTVTCLPPRLAVVVSPMPSPVWVKKLVGATASPADANHRPSIRAKPIQLESPS